MISRYHAVHNFQGGPETQNPPKSQHCTKNQVRKLKMFHIFRPSGPPIPKETKLQPDDLAVCTAPNSFGTLKCNKSSFSEGSLLWHGKGGKRGSPHKSIN